jgi:GGDEF domain-containing protein
MAHLATSERFHVALSQSIRLGNAAAHMGGDEFVVVLPGVGDAAEATRIAELIASALVQPNIFNDGVLTPTQVSVSASIQAMRSVN